MAGTKFPVKLFYDIISPYSWLAFESLCKYRGSWTKMDLILKPCSIFLLFKESGNPPPLFNPLKSAYIAKDCSRASKIFNVPLKFPSNFADLAVKKGSLKAMRFVMAIDELTNGQSTEAISRHLWRAVFTNEPGKDITDVKVWLEAGENAQIDRATLDKAIEQSNSEVIINKLVEQTKEAVKHGAFGLPTMIVESPDESKMLFGSDRIELLAYLIGEKYQGPCPVSKSNL